MSWFKEILTSFVGNGEAVKVENAPVQKELAEMQTMQQQNSERMEEVRKKRDEKEKIEDGLKLVIDTAELECKLCTKPQGVLKVNLDTPSIQSKKTATTAEKDAKSLIFKSTCKKSPNSASPCAMVMQLDEWKDTASSKSQEQSPLLLKSTIKCNYGSVYIKITNCGQREEPGSLNVIGVPIPNDKEEIKQINRHSKEEMGF